MHHWRSLEETYPSENFLEPSRTQPPPETMSMAELWLTKQRRPAATGFASPPFTEATLRSTLQRYHSEPRRDMRRHPVVERRDLGAVEFA